MLLFILFMSLFSMNNSNRDENPINLNSVMRICWIDDENIYVIDGKASYRGMIPKYEKPLRERIFHFNLKTKKLTPVFNHKFNRTVACLISPDGKYICSFNSQKDLFTVYQNGKELYHRDGYIKYLNKETVSDKRLIGRIELRKIYRDKIILLTSIPEREIDYFNGEQPPQSVAVNIIIFNYRSNRIEKVLDLDGIMNTDNVWSYGKLNKWIGLSAFALDYIRFYDIDREEIVYSEERINGRVWGAPSITKKYVYYRPEVSTFSSHYYPLYRVNRSTLKKEVILKQTSDYLGGDKYLLLDTGKEEKPALKLIRIKDGKEILQERLDKLESDYRYNISFSPDEKNLLAYDIKNHRFIVINIEK